jgi:5-formyltetrahydrofolate cyclo-ligase
MNQADIEEQKRALRKFIKERKKGVSVEKMTQDFKEIFDQVESLTHFRNARIVLVYWSLHDEVGTHDFVIKWAAKKKMVLPVIVGETLELREFNGLSELVASTSFGIKEPKTGNIVDPKDIDFAIIPGIAFDTKGNRLGRGKGYYDRILKQTRAFKVAVGFGFQILDSIPVASMDVPVDIVVTSKN